MESPLFYKECMRNSMNCTISLDNLVYLDNNIKRSLFLSRKEFITVLKKIENDIFFFDKSIEIQWKNEIEMVLFSRLQSLFDMETFFSLFTSCTSF